MLTVDRLIRQLQDIRDAAEAGGDTEVRIAYQPSWPLQGHLSDDLAVRKQGGNHKPETVCVYLLETSQVMDAPYAPAHIFSGKLNDAKPGCLACGKTRVVKRARGGFVCEACRTIFEDDDYDEEG